MSPSLQHLSVRQHSPVPCTPVRHPAEKKLCSKLAELVLSKHGQLEKDSALSEMAKRFNERARGPENNIYKKNEEQLLQCLKHWKKIRGQRQEIKESRANVLIEALQHVPAGMTVPDVAKPRPLSAGIDNHDNNEDEGGDDDFIQLDTGTDEECSGQSDDRGDSVGPTASRAKRGSSSRPSSHPFPKKHSQFCSARGGVQHCRNICHVCERTECPGKQSLRFCRNACHSCVASKIALGGFMAIGIVLIFIIDITDNILLEIYHDFSCNHSPTTVSISKSFCEGRSEAFL